MARRKQLINNLLRRAFFIVTVDCVKTVTMGASGTAVYQWFDSRTAPQDLLVLRESSPMLRRIEPFNRAQLLHLNLGLFVM